MPAGTNTLSLSFFGSTFNGSYPKNNLSLNFTGALINNKKESALNFWGGTYVEGISDFSVVKTYNIGISIYNGVIPPLNKLSVFNLSDIGISVDLGVLPPKNYFKSMYFNIGINTSTIDKTHIKYQIL